MLAPGGLFFVWAGVNGAGPVTAAYGAAIAAVSCAGVVSRLVRRT